MRMFGAQRKYVKYVYTTRALRCLVSNRMSNHTTRTPIARSRGTIYTRGRNRRKRQWAHTHLRPCIRRTRITSRVQYTCIETYVRMRVSKGRRSRYRELCPHTTINARPPSIRHRKTYGLTCTYSATRMLL